MFTLYLRRSNILQVTFIRFDYIASPPTVTSETHYQVLGVKRVADVKQIKVMVRVPRRLWLMVAMARSADQTPFP